MATIPRLEISCFGPPAVRLDDAPPPADVLWRKHLALLVYLALSPGRRRTREHLLGVLWPDKDEAQARHSLSEALRRLRAGLGAERLVASGDTLELAPEGLEVDALRFDAAAAADPSAAIALARGDFLEGIGAGDAAPLEEWVELVRGHYRARVTELLLAAGEGALAAGDVPRASELARRARERDPLSERPVRLLMRVLGLAGDPAGALEVYHAFAARLQAELAEQPGRDLAALAERLRSGRWRAPAAGEAAEAEPPLVGRESVHRAVFELVAAALAGSARVLLTTAADGMGRSRLLAECGRRAALDGALVATARPLASDHDAAWSTLRQLMRGGLAQAPGALGTDPVSLAVMASFAPSLAERVSATEPRDVAHVAASLAAFLGALSEEQPALLVLDDAHLADGATLTALDGAVRALSRSAPVCLALSADDAIAAWPVELAGLARDVGDALSGLVVTLQPLGEPEVFALMRALWQVDEGEASLRLARRLRVECGGSPFLAVTLLRALATTRRFADDLLAWPPKSLTLEAPLPQGVSQFVRLAILTQLSGLGEPALHTLAAAALAGVPVDAALLSAAVGTDLETAESALVELERRRILAFQDGRYSFAAGVVAAVVARESLPPGRREAIRVRLVDALEARGDLEGRVAATALRAKSGPSAEVFAMAVGEAREALGEGARRTARRALRIAEGAADPADSAVARTLEEMRRAVELHRNTPCS